MQRTTPFVLVACLLAGPAAATQTMCDFHSRDSRYAFEFIGDGEIAMVQVNTPRGMRMTGYTVRDFDYLDRRIDLVHKGGEGTRIMPAFTLKGRGDNVLLRIEGREIPGVLHCQWQHDAPTAVR